MDAGVGGWMARWVDGWVGGYNRNLDQMTLTSCFLSMLKEAKDSEIYFFKVDFTSSLCMVSWFLASRMRAQPLRVPPSDTAEAAFVWQISPGKGMLKSRHGVGGPETWLLSEERGLLFHSKELWLRLDQLQTFRDDCFAYNDRIEAGD